MQEVVDLNPNGGQNFSSGKLSKIDPLVLKSHYNEIMNEPVIRVLILQSFFEITI